MLYALHDIKLSFQVHFLEQLLLLLVASLNPTGKAHVGIPGSTCGPIFVLLQLISFFDSDFLRLLLAETNGELFTLLEGVFKLWKEHRSAVIKV